MGLIAQIIAALSADVMLGLVAAGYPALTDGEIVVGPAAEYEQGTPPRIIFDPTGSKFVAAEYYSGGSTVIHTEERELQTAKRTIAGDNLQFQVHCWGAADSGVVVDDYDVTRALYHQLRATLQAKIPGAFAIEDGGKFRKGTNLVRLGRWFEMGLVLYTPVLESLVPFDRSVSFASAAVQADGTDELVIPTTGPREGPGEAGC